MKISQTLKMDWFELFLSDAISRSVIAVKYCHARKPNGVNRNVISTVECLPI